MNGTWLQSSCSVLPARPCEPRYERHRGAEWCHRTHYRRISEMPPCPSLTYYLQQRKCTHLFAVKGSKNIFKSPTHWVLVLLLGFGLYWVFGFFCLNEQFGSLLVDSAHQVSVTFNYFHQYFRFSINLQIHYLSVVRSCKHKEIITGITNWNLIKFGAGFFGMTQVSEPCH